MALTNYVISFVNTRNGTHIIESYWAETEVIAAIVVISNETDYDFCDLDRSDYFLDDLQAELYLDGCYVKVREINDL